MWTNYSGRKWGVYLRWSHANRKEEIRVFTTDIRPSLFVYGNPASFNSQECEGMRSRLLTFEESGIDHVGLIQICFSAGATVSRVYEKNSLPVSVVESIEIPKQISYVLRGIKRAISRRLVKISDCRVSSFLKTVPGRRVSRHLIFRIWKLKFKRNALICHWLIPLFVYCRNNCTLCCKSAKEYSEKCMFWGYKVMADLWRPMLNKIGEEIKHKFPICMHAMSDTG